MDESLTRALALLYPWLLATLDVAVAAFCTVHIILNKRDVRSAIGWTGLVWLAPFLGAFTYFCFGINRIYRRASEIFGKEAGTSLVPLLTAEDFRIHDEFIVAHPTMVGLARVARRLTGASDLPGNRIQPLVDGDQTFPAMLEAIRQAERCVTLLSYIFDADRAGLAFSAALQEAAGRGVQVRVLIDDVGARYSRPNMAWRLHAAGVPTATFLPTRIPRLVKYANLRNHRKILVVDGRLGFTGGTNIREAHWLSLAPRHPVRCLHFRLDGPVVHHLQRIFAVDWEFATGEALTGDLWFPSIERAGPVWAQGVPDGPDDDFEKLTDLIIAALSAATRSVRIVTPYFLPDGTLIRALNVAALRGVDVRIFIPARTNIAPVAWAAMAQAWQLLEKGCRIFLTPPPFDHTKLFTVDKVWSLIGSTNWDPRSLRLNFEFNVQCFNEELGAQLDDLVNEKAAGARELTLAEVEGRSLPIRLRDGLARLLSPYM
ncbi:MAG: phospholipase D-like domain-containing protein [Pirellulaceae bacterium]|jgi:cardiolipin synthase|nr:phospholipase D-like domain-containing protein [Pirellulaceae bacterium]